MLDFHVTGGMEYMAPLSLMLLFNLGVIGSLVLARLRKKPLNSLWLEVVRHVGLLAMVWGLLSTIIGLYHAFGALSQMTETLPFNVIMGGLQVALITAEYGLVIGAISMVAYLVLKIMNREVQSQEKSASL